MRSTLSVLLLLLLFISTLFPSPSSASFIDEAVRPAPSAAEKFDYVMILAYNDLVFAVDTLKSWKESLGFSVKVIDVDQIFTLYPSGDDAEKIWNFLHDRYTYENWAIRYVLLVGDIDRIPIRMLYPDGNFGDGLGYGCDYYYANLDQTDWDADGDNRWGEFKDDNLDIIPEVVVGRIPSNHTPTVQAICEQIVAYERDLGAWKRSAFLAHGIMDYTDMATKSDQSVLAEKLIADFFQPLGWSTHTLYEEGGISPTARTHDDSLCQTNYENNCGLHTWGVASCNAHGWMDGFTSYQWSADLDNDGKWDPDGDAPEVINNGFSRESEIDTHPLTSIMMLTGCCTGAIVGTDTNYVSSPLCSRYLVRIPRNNTLAETYLAEGCPVTIAPSAGGDYSKSDWTSVSDPSWNSLSYLFFDYLIDCEQRAGDAFFNAQRAYANTLGLKRGIRDFNFFGDPSLKLKGIDNRPGGMDRLIHEGNYEDYAADNDDDGTMYVGVAVTDYNTSPGTIRIYKSTDHGVYWNLWSIVTTEGAIWDMDVIVNRFSTGGPSDDKLHVVYATGSGAVLDVRVALDDSLSQTATLMANAGHWAKHLSLARVPQTMPGNIRLYAAWEYEDNGVYYVKAVYSTDNGASWTDSYQTSDRQQPHIDAGPAGRVYIAMAKDIMVEDSDVTVVVSNDYGASWGSEVNLTVADDALMHSYPLVAASTDPSYPAAWVIYDYQTQSDEWGVGRDLCYAYTADAGATWHTDRIISADAGVDEWLADASGYRASANRWVNLVFNSDPYPNPDYRRTLVWRYTSGGLPQYWSYERIMNDYDTCVPAADRPLILYSPGIGPGSGVVYGGANRYHLYFSAPWLPGPAPVSPAVAAARQAPERKEDMRARGDDDSSIISRSIRPRSGGAPSDRTRSPVPRPVPTANPPIFWMDTGDLPDVFTVSSLSRAANGDLLASGTFTSAAEKVNHGAVFRSSDNGATWYQLGVPAGSWSLGCLLEYDTGAFIAGGTALPDESGHQAGTIYRSTDYGDNWIPVLETTHGVVTDIIRTASGSFIATAGWDGQLFQSDDGGQTWGLLAGIGDGNCIHDIVQRANGDFVIGLGGPAASPVMYSTNGVEWTAASGLDEVTAVYQLLESSAGILYAAGERDGHGCAFLSDSGLDWAPLPGLPAEDITAALSLVEGPDGRIFIGTACRRDRMFTRVYYYLPGAIQWMPFGGAVDLASSVHCMLATEAGLYIGTGPLYGNVYTCSYDLLTGVEDEDVPEVPHAIIVEPSQPNPFNPATTLSYYLPEPAGVTLAIFDVAGRLVRTLENGDTRNAGWHRVQWNGLDEHGQTAASGVYFYRFAAGSVIKTGKMTLLK